MPVFTVKKTREGQNQEEEMNIPNEVFSKILLLLDGRSLQTARQVCPDWNIFIKDQVLGTVEGRRVMERTLQHQWRESAPARSEFTIEGLSFATVLTVTDKFAVIHSETSSGMMKINVVKIREGVEVFDLSCLANWFRDALISKNVLLLLKWVDGEWEVLAWNIHTKEKIFNKKFPAGRVVLDHHNQQMMVGRKTRLEISGTVVIENIQAPLPGDCDLLAFSHPLYITRSGPRGDGAAGTLRKVDGSEVTRVGDLGVVGYDYPVFCPAREILVQCSPLDQNKIKLRVFSSLTGDLIKDRVLTVTTDIDNIYSCHVNTNQLVMDISKPRRGSLLLVYELDCLLSQSADQEMTPRMLQIGQPGFQVARSYLDKTSVMAGLERTDTVKIITLDFWNSEN